jgi:hypothetical protein
MATCLNYVKIVLDIISVIGYNVDSSDNGGNKMFTMIREKTGEKYEVNLRENAIIKAVGWAITTKRQVTHLTFMADEEDFEAIQKTGRIEKNTITNLNDATQKQIEYLIILGINVEIGLSKQRASELIDAAKSKRLGSVGGWYRDGSN